MGSRSLRLRAPGYEGNRKSVTTWLWHSSILVVHTPQPLHLTLEHRLLNQRKSLLFFLAPSLYLSLSTGILFIFYTSPVARWKHACKRMHTHTHKCTHTHSHTPRYTWTPTHVLYCTLAQLHTHTHSFFIGWMHIVYCRIWYHPLT